MARYENTLKAEDVAAVLGIGRNAVYDLAKRGELKSYRMGRKLLFTLADVEEYFRACSGKDAEASATEVPSEGAAGTEADLAAALDAFSPAGTPLRVAGVGTACSALVSALHQQGLLAVQKPVCDYAALGNLYAGTADAAVVTLYDHRTNTCNVPFVQRMAPGQPVVVFNLVTQRVGFVVKTGNPKQLISWSKLFRHNVRLVNQAKGTAERILLDGKALALEGIARTVEGYDFEAISPYEAALRVSQGIADVCVATEADAAAVAGVQFVPLQTVVSSLVVRKAPETKDALRQLKDLLARPKVKKAFTSAFPCDASNLGAITYEC
ncbi:MAG: helix-turn-helix transcriptional regulator [Coriobacteriia bacterium]|nr:helix-turn-helix transcriptional regulator [Coriobacteriia bacterium]